MLPVGKPAHVPRAIWIAMLSVAALVILNAIATTLAHPDLRTSARHMATGRSDSTRAVAKEAYAYGAHPMVINMPSEEVFTTLDHRRTEGVVPSPGPSISSARASG